MFALSKNNFFALTLILLLVSGCAKKTTTKSTLSSTQQNTLNKKTPANNKFLDPTMLTETNITYNYTPDDFLDENLFQNLVLSEHKSYQLKTSNGSRLPEQDIFELEKLALASKDKEDNFDAALNLWQENEDDFLDTKQLELVYFNPKHTEIEEEQQKHLEKSFKLAKNAIEQGQRLVIRGHSDAAESDNQVFELSFERAKTVKDQLVKMGLEANMISIVAVGASEPIIPKSYKASAQANSLKTLNCRAEIVVS